MSQSNGYGRCRVRHLAAAGARHRDAVIAMGLMKTYFSRPVTAPTEGARPGRVLS